MLGLLGLTPDIHSLSFTVVVVVMVGCSLHVESPRAIERNGHIPYPENIRRIAVALRLMLSSMPGKTAIADVPRTSRSAFSLCRF